MECGTCSEANRDGASFCAHCGAPLALNCGSCGRELAAGARFCDERWAELVDDSTDHQDEEFLRGRAAVEAGKAYEAGYNAGMLEEFWWAHAADFRFEDRRTALRADGGLEEWQEQSGVGLELGYDKLEVRTIVVLGDRVLVREAVTTSEQGFSSSSVSAARQGIGGVNVFFDADRLDEAYAVARELYDELEEPR